MRSTLAMEHVAKSFISGGQRVEILHDISYAFTQGNTYALTGVSGTGKSTVLYILAGLEKPDAGSVLFDGIDIDRYTPEEREHFLNKHVGCIFQSASLLPELTVVENVMLKGLIAKVSYESCIIKAQNLLDRVGLGHKAYASPATLSGGEAQRVALLRALFLEPRFLLADEPTAHLDAHNRSLIMDMILDYQQHMHMGLIICTHDPFVASRLDTVLTVVHGGLKEHGAS